MLDNLMIDTVSVQRPTNTKDSSGAPVKSYATVYADVPANVQPITASWQIQYAQRKIDTSHTVAFVGVPAILNGDQIIFGTRTFLVVGIRNLAGRGVVTAVDCKEIT